MTNPEILPTTEDVGLRVSLRLHDPEGGFRDLLGYLISPTQVRKKSGEVVTFNPQALALWKVVPDSEIGTGIFLYDTKLRANQELTISNGRELRMYCCGPTVYRDVHVGNLRTFLLADLVTRLTELLGFSVKAIQNITDVGHMGEDFSEALLGNPQESGDDKVLEEAHKKNIDPLQLARSYEEKYHRDAALIGIKPAQVYPRASESIEMMHQLIGQLIESQNAYVGEDQSVYFDARTFESYGALSGNRLDALKPGHRYEYTGDGAKRFHADWALWKSAGSRSEMIWDSPWGPGFPGWHIECSAMSLHYLQGHADIHLGGIDLRFPHHENERAQSNCATHNEVTDLWLHGEHLLFEGKKMSKSSGNVLLVSDVIERGLDPLAIRLAFMENRYRSQLDLTWAQLEAADSTITRWREKYQLWADAQETPDLSTLERLINEIVNHLKDDLDTAGALIQLREIERDAAISEKTKALLFERLEPFFALDILRTPAPRELPTGASELLEERAQARAAKEFARSDELRDQLLAMNVKVIDGPSGQSWQISTR